MCVCVCVCVCVCAHVHGTSVRWSLSFPPAVELHANSCEQESLEKSGEREEGVREEGGGSEGGGSEGEREEGVLSHWSGAPSGRREGPGGVSGEQPPAPLPWRGAGLQGRE